MLKHDRVALPHLHIGHLPALDLNRLLRMFGCTDHNSLLFTRVELTSVNDGNDARR